MNDTPEPGPEATDLVPLERHVGERFLAAMTAAPNVTIDRKGDPEEMELQIVERILAAETLDQINQVFEGGVRSSQDLAAHRTPVWLLSVRVMPSNKRDRQGRRGWWGLYEASDDDGAKVLIGSSSKAVLAAFVNADHRGLTPIRGYFVEAGETEAGGNPIHFHIMEGRP